MTTTPARAAAAIATVFLMHGFIIGSWVAHIPLVKQTLGVGPGPFSIGLLSVAAGAVTAMPIAGLEINRHGSRAITLFTAFCYFAALALPAFATSLPWMMAGGFIFGAGLGSTDVAMNAHGLAVETRWRRPIMSGLHGLYAVGGLLGAAFAALLLPVAGAGLHVALASSIAIAALLLCRPLFLPAEVDKGLSGSHFAWPTRATIGLGLLCFLALMSEGAVLDWAAIHFTEHFLVEASTAAWSFALFSAGMAASRLTGDFLRQRFGAHRMVVASALATGVAMLAVIMAPSFAMGLAAITLLGLAIGNVAPVLFAGGGRLEPDAPGRGIAAVTTLGYSGFLAGPPLIGFIAEFASLRFAFLAVVVASIIIAVFARRVAAADTY